jgi:hypothetical protein
MKSADNFNQDEPLAQWQAAFLPDWTWEALEKEDEELYFGRVKSPLTYDRWEYGYFSEDQLKEAGAYRTDLDPDSDEPLYPDGGITEDIVGVYETELEALLQEQEGDDQYKR